ncbi:ectonucleotide pyrophosphatase/phosphodiesterase family member 3 [Annulohypoxylon truncatum]|uniref:ectonucleotide pyrophosphatase/phosphodiesterase family member 3 n=1 Tax=Annulohypoxylon truncatum TaxID=327061 RepID=UPI0020078D5F|nr:ectonucleotide pyrophosphatase/phosphodiesterase family member 3 [Annulohypoxylon truncatum]KAI1206670.1 ectonucleotide pyrophosphatase/phosphodiesterase family member 3 [Annulohypoxylon truncatum]
MPLQPINTNVERDGSLLSPIRYDDDAISLHSRSDQDTDSEDDELLAAARNSKELRARDRMVLMEEEELDKLITDSRARRERERRGSSIHRRGSNLALPNPIRMLRGYNLTGSGSAIDDAGSSAEDLHHEKRRNRRTRRKEKKDRLLREARDGEDGELMYEMESGGMKDGSTTGDSSDRDDSDELDRKRLIQVSDAKTAKTRRWKKWLLIHATIIVGVAFLGLVIWKLVQSRKTEEQAQLVVPTQLVSNGSALFLPTTLIISLDGFRADFLNRGLTPRLNSFIKEGVSPLYMTPSFPSVTFPNHYTLATGLYPESHGVVGNTFWDPDLEGEFYYTDPDKSLDPKWWAGEPFWVTAEQQGVRTAVHMWPGSEAHIMGVEPSFLDKYNGKEKLNNKVDRILEFLDKPGVETPDADPNDIRPQIIAAYVPNVDADGHRYGPNSTRIRSTIHSVDKMLNRLFHGLEKRNLTDIVNVIIVSDHGMATTDVSRMIQIEDLVDIEKVEHLDGWPLVGIRPKNPDDLQLLYEQAAEKVKSNPNFEVYLRDKDMPERYHFSNNKRIAPLWIIPKTGWAIVKREEFDIQEAKAKNRVYHPRGLHGYDHEHPLMRAIFVARGPAFPHQPHSKVEIFQNINVYNILCDSVGMKAMPNNGTLHLPLKITGLHDPDAALEEPADPVPVETTPEGEIATGTTSDPHQVETTSEGTEPSSTVGVDPAIDKPEEQSPPANDENNSSGSSWWQNTWDWVKDKFDGLIDTVKGIGKGSS